MFVTGEANNRKNRTKHTVEQSHLPGELGYLLEESPEDHCSRRNKPGAEQTWGGTFRPPSAQQGLPDVWFRPCVVKV